MSHFQALVGITHTRTTTSATSGRRSHNYSPHTIITERMFPSRVISISKRRKPSISLMTPSSSLKITPLVTIASSNGPYSHPQPEAQLQSQLQAQLLTRPRRIVRRKLAAEIFGADLDIISPETSILDPDLDPEGAQALTPEGSSDESDDVTLVGRELELVQDPQLLSPKVSVSVSPTAAARGGVVKTSAMECHSPPLNRVSRKIISHISDFSFDSPETSDIDEVPSETASDADADDSSPTSHWSPKQRLTHQNEKENQNESDESWPSSFAADAGPYMIEVEERTIVYHTALCPPPWYRRARQIQT